MFLRRKFIIILTILILSLSVPFSICAFDLDSIYVWSNDSSVTTSAQKNSPLENNNKNSRKLSKYNFRKCYFNGTKNRHHLI